MRPKKCCHHKLVVDVHETKGKEYPVLRCRKCARLYYRAGNGRLKCLQGVA